MVAATTSLVLFLLTIFFEPVCGSNFNPAVTLGILVYKGLGESNQNFWFAALIMFAQLFGAVIGAIFVLLGVKITEAGTDPEIFIMQHPLSSSIDTITLYV